MTRTRVLLATASVAAMLALTGCTDAQENAMTPPDVDAIKRALAAKGSAEDEAARLQPLVVQMADALAALVPGRTWQWNREPMRLSCEAVPGDPGSASALTLPNAVFDGPIPDDVWPEAVTSVQGFAAQVGATELVVRVDRPGHHDIQLVGPDKVQFGLATREASVLLSQTGCHLLASDEDEYGS